MRGVLRALSVEVTSKGFSFAVLEGTERLVDWGGRQVEGGVPAFLPRLKKLAERYRPDVLVIEDPACSRKGSRTRAWLAWAEEMACEQGLRVCTLQRARFCALTQSYGRTKRELAVTAVRLFPELAPLLPRPRKAWESEARALAVFVAVARGVEALRSAESLRSAETEGESTMLLDQDEDA